jgi:lipopolysaccharide/colanic/teichoic acid biosynthesis glycosyltransferase
MTGLTPSFGNGQGLPQPEAMLAAAEAELWERPLGRSLTWPTTRLARWFVSLLLAAGLYFPAVAGERHEWRWIVIVALTGVVALSTRALLEAVGLATQPDGITTYVVAPMLAGLAATWLMAGASAIVGLGWSLAVVSLTFALTVLTLAMAGAIRRAEIHAELGLRRLYFVGSPQSRWVLQRELARSPDRQLVGSRLCTAAGDRLDAAALEAEVLALDATVVILDSSAAQIPGLEEAVARLGPTGVRLGEFAAFYEAEFKKVPLTALPSDERVLEVVPRDHRVIYRVPRRMVEVWAAAALLLVASPLLLLAVLAIRLTSRGPALYRQRRVGRGGKQFTLVKLRTMTMTARQEACWAQSDAHRVTWIGSYLRRFRVDELPQLWNVLRGDLALIGPRPEQVPIVERLGQELPHYSLRHCIRPGITGWAQVNLGYAGSVEGTLAKLERDLFYVKRRSLRLDALIVWLTLKTVLAGRGA